MIRIIADSSCDISKEFAEELGIELIPMPVNFGNDTFYDGVDITAQQFFEKLKTAKDLPTTSQPSPLEFMERYEEAKKNGDSILLILLSSKISGSYGSACLYKNEIGYENIEVIDSLATVGAMQLLVIEAVKQRNLGKMDVHQLAEHLNNFKKRIKLLAVIDTLEYLHKGGRLSGAAKVFGTLLNIKPIISIVDGEIHMINKKAGINKAIDQIVQDYDKYDIDTTQPILFGYSATPDRMNMLIQHLKKEHDLGDFLTASLGPVVGVHVGPGACYVTFVVKKGTE